MKCPNLKHPDAVELIGKIGMVDFFKEYRRHNFEMPDPSKYQDSLKGVNAMQKIVSALMSDKAQQNFTGFFKKGNQQKFFKELQALGAPAPQIAALQKWAQVNDAETLLDLAAAVMSENSFAIEVQDNQAGSNKDKENINIAGGQNYQNSEIRVPGVKPVIKGHVGFATDEGIGWFRHDVSETDPTMRRVLEFQSDLFQKARGRQDLVKIPMGSIGDADVVDGNDGFMYMDRNTDLDSDEFGSRFMRVSKEAYNEQNPEAMLEAVEESSFEEFENARYSSTEADPEYDQKNSFLQLLANKDGWVSFFMRTIMQDSARKGFKKVSFPSAETVMQIQNFNTNVARRTAKQELLSAMDSRKAALEKIIAENPELAEQADKDLIQLVSDQEFEQTNLAALNDTFERKQKPVMNFYGSQVQNFLRKNYPVTDTIDEAGNTWYSVEVDPNRDLAPISYYDNSNADATIVTVYQGYDGPFADNRSINYFAGNEKEAGDYGSAIRSVRVDTAGFVNGFSAEEYDLRAQFSRQYKKTFDLFDNSPEGLATQELYFYYLKSKGYKGWNSLNREDAAYVITFDNDVISQPDEAGSKPQEVEALMSEKLINFLGKLNVTVEEYEDLQAKTGFNAIGVTDLLYKTVLIKQGVPESVLAKETAYVALSFLGKKNKIRTDLMASIEELDGFADRALFYKDMAGEGSALNEYKIKELVLVDFLADAIRAEWDAPVGEYEGREADYWRIQGKTKLIRRIKYLLGKLRRAYNEFLKKSPLSEKGVNDLLTDVANDILTYNFRKFNTDLSPEQQQVFYEETISKDPKALEIVQFMQGQNLLLTGSLALRKQGSMYRSKAENLHDLDFTMVDQQVRKQMDKLMEDRTIKAFPGVAFKLDKEDFSAYMLNYAKAVLKEIPIVQTIQQQYPSFEITNVFKGINNGYTITGVIDGKKNLMGKISGGYMIDIFMVNEDNLDQNEASFQDWEPIFKAKIAMGRAKDISDFANYVPFSEKRARLAQQPGFRHFNFAPVGNQPFRKITGRRVKPKPVKIRKASIFEKLPQLNEMVQIAPYIPRRTNDEDFGIDSDSLFDNTMFTNDFRVDRDFKEEYNEHGKSIFGTDWEDIRDDIIDQNSPMRAGIFNPATQKPYTYLEYWNDQWDLYQQNKAILIGLYEKINNQDYLGYTGDRWNIVWNTSTDDLLDTYKKMLLMGDMEKKNMGEVFLAIGNHLGDRMTLAQLTQLSGINPDPDKIKAADKEQRDISIFEVWMKAKSDFGIHQAGMQYASKQISGLNKLAEQEAFAINQDLQAFMTEVMTQYYRDKPKNFRQKINIFGRDEYAQKPFQWLYEVDRKGYTRFISKKSPVFKAMLQQANAVGDSPAKDLANANIALYDFIYNTNKDLFKETRYDGEQGDRAMMPHTSMDTYETYKKFGLFRVYMNTFVPDFNETLRSVEVEFDGIKKTVGAWRDELYDKDRGFIDKILSPKKLNKILQKAEDMIIAGETNITGMELRQLTRDFRNSSELPFRSLMRRQDASVNTFRILSNHFNSLVFKKHLDPAVPLMHIVHAYYKDKSQNNSKTFKNTMKYIETYSDRFLFQQMDDSSKTMLGVLMQKLTVAAVLSFLGFSPKTSLYNAVTGMYFGLNTIMADEASKPNSNLIKGIVEGGSKYKRGFARLMGSEMKGFGMKSKWQNGNILFSPKAMAILEFYNIETFSKLDIERVDDMFENVKDKLMLLQRNSELLVRGISFFAELSEDQWNAFKYIDKDDPDPNIDPQDKGKLDVNAVRLAMHAGDIPDNDQVTEWNYYISAQQGNYAPEDKRNYHINTFFKAAMLFKGWVPDYVETRYRKQWVDQYGLDREGYYRTAGRLIADMTVHNANNPANTGWRTFSKNQNAFKRRTYNVGLVGIMGLELIWKHKQVVREMRAKNGGNLTKMERRNLAKLSYDVALHVLFLAARGLLDEEDPEEKYISEMIAKLSSQLFFGWRFGDMLKTVKSPFPQLVILEKLLAALYALMDLEFKKAGKNAFGVVPGNRAATFAYDTAEYAVSEDEE